MAVLKGILFVISLWGWLFLTGWACRIKVWFVPIVTAAGLGITLYAGGLFGFLKETAVLLYAAGFAGTVLSFWAALTRRFTFPKLSMFGFFFASSSVLFAVLIWNLKLLHYDNFSHWAVVVKYMLSTDHFADASTELLMFKDYPPGSAVWIYYVCRFAGHSQGIMLLAHNSLIFSCFFAVFGWVRERRRFLLYAFLGMGCSMLSYLNLTIRINNLLVDFLLPLLAMAGISAANRMKEEPLKMSVCVMLLTGYTGIIKDTGAVFAGIAFLYYVWCICSSPVRYRPFGKELRMHGHLAVRIAAVLLTGAGGALPYIGWKWYLASALDGYAGKFSAGAGQSAAEPELYGTITREFFHSAFSVAERSFQAFLLCTIVTVGAVLYARIFLKRRWKLWRVWILGSVMLILHYAGILLLYLYSMPAEEAVRLAGFDRYTCSIMTLFAGLLIMGAEADMENSFAVGIDERGAYRAYSSPEAKHRYQLTVLVMMVIGINFLYSEYNGLSDIRKGYQDSLPGRVEALAGDRWYPDGREDESRYLVAALDEGAQGAGQVSDGEVRYVCRYFLYAPYVDVTSRLDMGTIGEAAGKYDYILILDTEAVEYAPDFPEEERIRTPGLYDVQDLPYSYQKSTGHGII